jgi:SPP1 gp7 family putative phage head morphogenesis protein
MAAVPLQDAMLRHQVLVQRLSSAEVEKFRPFLREIDRAIRDALTDETITQLARYRLEQLLGAVDTLLAGILNRYSAKLLTDLETYALHEAKFAAASLDVVSTFDAVVPSATQIRAAILSTPLSVKGRGRGQLLQPWLDQWTQAEIRAVNGAIRRGAFEGKTNQQLIRELRGSHDRNYQDGVIDITRRSAEAVVRTAVQHVASVAREETYKANKDIISVEQWLATLDKRTCPSCRALDGKEFARGKGPKTPLHINCRCIRIPVLKEEYAYLQSGETRASKGAKGGGQVAADLSYYEWLKLQPAWFQDQAIGPVRGALLRKGGLSAEDFARLSVDKYYAPLTLDEMRTLDPMAFKRAGV